MSIRRWSRRRHCARSICCQPAVELVKGGSIGAASSGQWRRERRAVRTSCLWASCSRRSPEMSIHFSGSPARRGGLMQAIIKQLKRVNLRPTNKINVRFDPFDDRSKQTRLVPWSCPHDGCASWFSRFRGNFSNAFSTGCRARKLACVYLFFFLISSTIA